MKIKNIKIKDKAKPVREKKLQGKAFHSLQNKCILLEKKIHKKYSRN